MKMSLHRIIAEIKSIEEKLRLLPSADFVFQTVNDDVAEMAVHITKSQATFDKYQAMIANLASLKAARNKANSAVAVTIGGKSMTIDEALSLKAALPHKQAMIQRLQAQFVAGQRAVDLAQANIETRLQQQIAAMFTGTRKATQDEVDLLRGSIERNQKVKLLSAPGLKDRIDALKAEVEVFTTEVDYVLSEANATNSVEVAFV